MTDLTARQVLSEIQYALNRLPNMRLQGAPHGTPDTYTLAVHVGRTIRDVDRFLALSKSYREANPRDPTEDFIEQIETPRHTVIGKVSGLPREGDQVPGMPNAICHACGLGHPCVDPDCPNSKEKTCD